MDVQRFEKLSQGLKFIESVVNKNKELRYYGGARFNRKSGSSREWEEFGKYLFVLPRFELRKNFNEMKLTVTINAERKQEEVIEILTDLQKLLNASEPEFPVKINTETISEQPERPVWNEEMADLLQYLNDQSAQKVVLARKKNLQLNSEILPENMFLSILDHQPAVYQFLFQPDAQNAFMGRTPERLFRVEDGSVTTEAIAGTRLRGETEENDQILAKELLENHKDIEEHRRVSEMLEETLAPYCDQFTCLSREQILKLKNVQHLKTEFRGDLKKNTSIADLLLALHPTPAVGGVPRIIAFQKIAQLEKFDRGWYAGPVGWIGADKAEFSVAIRSMLVQEQMLHLFAGAGIMPDSTADEEWQEVENKMNAILDGLR